MINNTNCYKIIFLYKKQKFKFYKFQKIKHINYIECSSTVSRGIFFLIFIYKFTIVLEVN